MAVGISDRIISDQTVKNESVLFFDLTYSGLQLRSEHWLVGNPTAWPNNLETFMLS